MRLKYCTIFIFQKHKDAGGNHVTEFWLIIQIGKMLYQCSNLSFIRTEVPLGNPDEPSP